MPLTLSQVEPISVLITVNISAFCDIRHPAIYSTPMCAAWKRSAEGGADEEEKIKKGIVNTERKPKGKLNNAQKKGKGRT